MPKKEKVVIAKEVEVKKEELVKKKAKKEDLSKLF